MSVKVLTEPSLQSRRGGARQARRAGRGGAGGAWSRAARSQSGSAELFEWPELLWVTWGGFSLGAAMAWTARDCAVEANSGSNAQSGMLGTLL